MESNERENYSEENNVSTDSSSRETEINNTGTSEYAGNGGGHSYYNGQNEQPYGYQYNNGSPANSSGYSHETNSQPYYGATQNSQHYGQNYNQGTFYSSNQHAGYNSQTGYTGAQQPAMGSDMYHKQQEANQTTAFNEAANDTKSREEQKAEKKAEKMIYEAKKKADKKSTKENAKRAKQARGSHGKSKAKKAASLVAAAVVFGLVAGTVFQGVRYGSDKFINKNNSTSTTAETEQSTKESTTALVEANTSSVSTVYDVADVAEKVMPSIVSITGTYVTTYQYWFDYYEEETPGAGSGIIIGQDDDNLLVLTNYHVVEDAKELSVSFIDGESADATVKGYDSANDIAIVLVKLSDIKEDTMNQIKEITVGSSDSLRVGDPCVAIGNALGYGQSVTVGYVSALNREISVDDGGTITVIQTDAAINPGNSGGALVNMNGELIGVNTAKYVDSTVEGTGYALPISNIQDKINSLIAADGSQSESGNAYLGITAKDITSDYAEGLNMPEGVYVYSVSENSPAEKCGLLTGDIIVGFDGEDIESSTDLQTLIGNSKVGDSVEVVFYRNENGKYEKHKVTATLEAKDE
jgi:serine protease Do